MLPLVIVASVEPMPSIVTSPDRTSSPFVRQITLSATPDPFSYANDGASCNESPSPPGISTLAPTSFSSMFVATTKLSITGPSPKCSKNYVTTNKLSAAQKSNRVCRFTCVICSIGLRGITFDCTLTEFSNIQSVLLRHQGRLTSRVYRFCRRR